MSVDPATANLCHDQLNFKSVVRDSPIPLIKELGVTRTMAIVLLHELNRYVVGNRFLLRCQQLANCLSGAVRRRFSVEPRLDHQIPLEWERLVMKVVTIVLEHWALKCVVSPRVVGTNRAAHPALPLPLLFDWRWLGK